MKFFKGYIIIGLLIIVGCTGQNDDVYIGRIKEKLKNDASGVELNYISVEFQWIDTLYVEDLLKARKEEFKSGVDIILNIQQSIPNGIGAGRVFSKSFLSKEKILELRNWEKNVGHPNESYGTKSSWVEEGYKDYYDFAFANRGASDWISELCSQIEETDSLIVVFEDIEEGNLSLINNVLWYYHRIDNYNSNHNPKQIWGDVEVSIRDLKSLKDEIDSLSVLNSEKVVYYKAFNKYEINNPLLNGVKQELAQNFYFDDNFQIIRVESFKKNKG